MEDQRRLDALGVERLAVAHAPVLLERRLGCRVTGIEQNPVVAAGARDRISRVICRDARRLDLSDRFDLILALELLEHVDDGDEDQIRRSGFSRFEITPQRGPLPGTPG